MVTLKSDRRLNANSGKPGNPVKFQKTKFTVFGEAMIEKEVKLGGSTGRVYLPSGWVGKRVKIIRVD